MALLNTATAVRNGPAAASAVYAGPTKVWPEVWSPAKLPGLVALYDASNLASITAAAGKVTQWNTTTGTAHLTQATTANQPSTGVATMNGHNVVRFDGTNDFMQSAGAPVNAQPFTVLMIYKLTDAAKGRVFDSANRALANATVGAGSPHGIYAGSSANVAQLQTTNPVCHMNAFNGAASKIQINGALTAALNPGGGPMGPLLFGGDGSVCAAVDFAVFAVCTGDQSASFPNFLGYARSVWGTP